MSRQEKGGGRTGVGQGQGRGRAGQNRVWAGQGLGRAGTGPGQGRTGAVRGRAPHDQKGWQRHFIAERRHSTERAAGGGTLTGAALWGARKVMRLV